MAEMLTDGGFELWTSATAPVAWSKSLAGTSTVNREATTKLAGNFSARLDIDSGNAAATLYQHIYLVPGRKYKLAVRYKNSAGSKTAKLAIWDDGSPTVYLQDDGTWGTAHWITLPNATDWATFTIAFTASPAYGGYYIEFQNLSAASSSIYFDACSLLSADVCGFFWQNLFDAGTLTASTEAANFPAANTRNRWPKRTWRSTALTDPQWLKLDAGAAIGVRAFIARYNNLTLASATPKIQAHASDSWGSPSIDQTIGRWTNDLMAYLWPSAQLFEWWRHAITDTGNSAGYVEQGRLYLGDVFIPSRTAIVGSSLGQPVDPSVAQFSDAGQISSIQRTKYKTGTFQFQMLPRADVDVFDAMFADRGNYKDLFFCADLGDIWKELYYVRIASYKTSRPNFYTWNVDIGLEELR